MALKCQFGAYVHVHTMHYNIQMCYLISITVCMYGYFVPLTLFHSTQEK